MVCRPMMDAPEKLRYLHSGTGLMGPLLKDLGVEHLEGVDLSSKMLQVRRHAETAQESSRTWTLSELNSKIDPTKS